jgi:hypothetical protein
MTTRAATALLALALLLPGCSDGAGDEAGGEAPPAAATPSQTAAAEAGAVQSTDELLATLEAAGVACGEPESGTFPGAAEAKSCIVNDSEDVVLLRFATEAEKQEYLDGKDELSSAVVGANWAIQTVLGPTAEQIQAAVGGEVVLGPSS